MDLVDVTAQLDQILVAKDLNGTKPTATTTTAILEQPSPAPEVPVVKKKKKKVTKKKAAVRDERDIRNEFNLKALTSAQEPSKLRFRKYCMADFYLLSMLGCGGFGKVYLAKLKNHDAYFALKVMNKRTIMEDNDLPSVLMEKKVMIYGNHNPFLCKLFACFQSLVRDCDGG